jgi:hypothetical protein
MKADDRVQTLHTASDIAGISWSAVIGGALAAAALAFILHSFAAAIGLAASSGAPTWRDASMALVLLSGLYLVLTALASYGFGAYLAARIRPSLSLTAAEADADYRDGLHGLLTWALATVLTGLMLIIAAQALPRLAAPSAGNAGPAASVAGENIIAFDLDRLFRGGERRQQVDFARNRAEAARILLTVSSHDGMRADDRAELVRLVSSTTGLAAADAERRVTEVSAQAKVNIDRARRSGVILAFMAGAATLLGAVIAWFASIAGGAHRDNRSPVPSYLDWARPSARRP